MKILTAKYCIEFAQKGNNNILWPLTLEVFRGRWDAAYVSGAAISDGMMQLHRKFPIIRGICVEVDEANKLARVFDPYDANESNGKEWQKLSAALAGVPLVGESRFSPLAEQKYKLDANKLKEWLYEMRRHVDAGLAVEVMERGYSSLPELEEIDMMSGKRRLNPYSAHHGSPVEFEQVEATATK